MKVKFKKLNPVAITPTYAKEGDAGLDLTATSINLTKNYIEYGTGIAIEIPLNHVGFLVPRSSVTETGLIMKNSIGIIDSGYRGEIRARYTTSLMIGVDGVPDTQKKYMYDIGDRVAQLIIVPIPTIELEEAEELSITERNTGGYGSTGK
jgi:dUTP pyrophosphatase